MQLTRPVIAADPRLFGRRHLADADAAAATRTSPGEDLRLFATTFAAGFLFVFVLVA